MSDFETEGLNSMMPVAYRDVLVRHGQRHDLGYKSRVATCRARLQEVTSCHVMITSRHVHVTSCHVTLKDHESVMSMSRLEHVMGIVMSRHENKMPRDGPQVKSWFGHVDVMSSHVRSRNVTSCEEMSQVMSHLAPSCHVMSYHVRCISRGKSWRSCVKRDMKASWV